MFNKDLFIHSKEKLFLQNVEENLKFKKEMEEYYINFYEKTRLPDMLGKTIKITEYQFPKIKNLIKEICQKLDLEEVEAFVFEDFYYGVDSKGISKCWLEISAKTLEDFSHEQLKFLISKELYNIKVKNTYYSALLNLGLNNMHKVSLPGNEISIDILKGAFYKWHRVMNLSSDNFGLIACGSLKVATEAIVLTILNSKNLVQNINIKEYVKQAEAISFLNDYVSTSTKLDELVPYGPYRIKNLITYNSSIRAKEAKIIF